MIVKPALIYGEECWPTKKAHLQRMKIAEMRMIRWIDGYTRLDKINNKVIEGKLGLTSIEDKIREVRLRWFGHIRRTMDASVRRCEKLDRPDHKQSRGKMKKSWSKVI